MPERICGEQDSDLNIRTYYSSAIIQNELKCQLKSFPSIDIPRFLISQTEIP